MALVESNGYGLALVHGWGGDAEWSQWSCPSMRFNRFYVLWHWRGVSWERDHKPRMDRGVNPSWPVIGGGELKYGYLCDRPLLSWWLQLQPPTMGYYFIGFLGAVHGMPAAPRFGECSLWQWTVQYAFESEWFMVAISHCFRWILVDGNDGWGFPMVARCTVFSLTTRAVIDLDWPFLKWHLILND